jgi:hypothetical protein
MQLDRCNPVPTCHILLSPSGPDRCEAAGAKPVKMRELPGDRRPHSVGRGREGHAVMCCPRTAWRAPRPEAGGRRRFVPRTASSVRWFRLASCRPPSVVCVNAGTDPADADLRRGADREWVAPRSYLGAPSALSRRATAWDLAGRPMVAPACVATLFVHQISLTRQLGPDEGGITMVARHWLHDGLNRHLAATPPATDCGPGAP